MKEKEHLPLLGVGPIIIALQVIITVIGIVISYRGYLVFGEIKILNIPLKCIGISLICFGVYLNYSAYSVRTAHPFRRNGAPFRFKLSKAQQVD